MAQTLFDKIWNDHIVHRSSGFPDTVYVDSHFIDTTGSPEVFDALRKRDISVFRSKQTLVLLEPEYPLKGLRSSRSEMFEKNCREFGIEIPETEVYSDSSLPALPGQIIVCNPLKKDKFGALGIISISINDIQTAQVLATQCILMHKPRTMKIEVNGKLAKGLRAKDISEYLISEISSSGAKGYFVEFGGDTILSLEMESRITLCNVSRSIGAVGGIIAPDELTIDYLKETGYCAEGEFNEEYPDSWKTLFSDDTSVFDEVLEFDAEDIRQGTHSSSVTLLLNTEESFNERSACWEATGFIEGNHEIDYILSQKDSIEEFEKSQAFKTYNGVNPF